MLGDDVKLVGREEVLTDVENCLCRLLHTFPLPFFLFNTFGGLEFFPEPELLDFYPLLFFYPPSPLTPPPHTYPQPKDTICSPTSVAIHSLCPLFPICRDFQGTFHSEIGFAQIQFWSNSKSERLWLIKHCFLSKLFFIFDDWKVFFPSKKNSSCSNRWFVAVVWWCTNNTAETSSLLSQGDFLIDTK